MKKQVTMADVMSEIEQYGKRRYDEGRAVAYKTVLTEATDLLATIERYQTVDACLCMVAEWLDNLEQIAALTAEQGD